MRKPFRDVSLLHSEEFLNGQFKKTPWKWPNLYRMHLERNPSKRAEPWYVNPESLRYRKECIRSPFLGERHHQDIIERGRQEEAQMLDASDDMKIRKLRQNIDSFRPTSFDEKEELDELCQRLKKLECRQRKRQQAKDDMSEERKLSRRFQADMKAIREEKEREKSRWKGLLGKGKGRGKSSSKK